MINPESLFQKLFENSNDIVLITDENFHIRYVSSAVERTFNVRPLSLLGRNAFDFVHPDKREVWHQCLKDANNNKSGEIFLNAPNGKELHFDVLVSNLVQHEHIRGLVVILHDITSRAEAQHELLKVNQHLGQFIFKTTHDLKAPLNSALGLAALAAQSDPGDREKYIRLVERTLQKMNTLIDELNQFYRVENLAVLNKPIDHNTFFEQEIEFIRNQPQARDIEITLSCNPMAELHSDPIRLQAIITNLISNSIKYADHGKAKRFIHISVDIQPAHCVISVRDNGIGIEEVHLSKVFEKFFRVRADIEGTGLGLYIVKDTVERLCGTIDVESRFGEGTTFTVRIPNFVAKDMVGLPCNDH